MSSFVLIFEGYAKSVARDKVQGVHQEGIEKNNYRKEMGAITMTFILSINLQIVLLIFWVSIAQ